MRMARETRGRRLRPHGGMLATAIAMAFLASAGGCGGEPPGARAVLLVTIDTLRADHVGTYGYPRDVSPSLDRYFARGAVFEYAFSTATETGPSHASMLTGKYPRFHTVGVRNAQHVLADPDTTLAERARASRIRTGAVISNFVLHSRFGFDRGFETYEDDFPSRELNRELPEQIARDAVDETLELVESFGGERWFAWLHLQDPHGPYDPPEDRSNDGSAAGPRGSGETLGPRTSVGVAPGLSMDLALEVGDGVSGYGKIPSYQRFGEERSLGEYVDRYDREIAFADRQLGRLLDHLDRTGALEHTLVIVTSDHGEAFGEDGYFFAHGHSLGPEQTRVPLAMFGAGVEPARFETPVSNIAVFATILNALGLSHDAVVEQSPDLWRVIRGEADAATPSRAFANGWTQDAVLASGLWLRQDRFDRGAQRFAQPPLPPLLGIGTLPGEQVHIVSPHPSHRDPAARPVAAARETLDGFVTEANAVDRSLEPVRQAPGELGASDRQKLRDLGYVR